MKKNLTLVFIVLSYISFAQTDIIEMRSRGASMKKYVKSTNTKNYDHVSSNFGMAPMPEIKTAVLDSIKILSDSTAVVYTSNYCTRGLRISEPFLQFDSLGRQLNEPIRQYSNPRVGRLWNPGADTVVNHPIFSQRHALDSVKDVIDRDYNFNLPSDSIRFIGFDNGINPNHSDSIRRGKNDRQKKNAFGWEIIFMIVSPILFLFGMNRLMTKTTKN